MDFLTQFLDRFLPREAVATSPAVPSAPVSQDVSRHAQHQSHEVSFDDLLRAMGADL